MNEKTTITTALKTLFEPGDVFEIRVLDAVLPNSNWQHVESGYFDYDHIDVIPNSLANFQAYGGVYITMNPVNPDLLARAANRLKKARSGETTSDGDILRRKWMLIDVDPVRPAGISATDSEKSAAFDLAMECTDGLASMGWPKPVIVDSGNGTQLLYRIDMPTDDGGLIQRCLQALQPVSTDAAHVDLSVHNPARICRLPGTWNRKGDHIETRPHRMAEILEIPPEISVVSEELLNSLAGDRSQDTNAEKFAGGDSDTTFDTLSSTAKEFNQRGDIGPLLEKHGWTQKSGPAVPDQQNQQQWWRPGKNTDSPSATYNGEVFYPFSDNAAPFKTRQGYNRFGVYAMLEHGGDKSAARDDLLAQGYGHDDSDVDFSGILGISATPSDGPSHNLQNEPEISDPGPIPEHLFDVPGLIRQVMDFSLANAPYPNVGLAFCGAMALQSYLCGRKVQTTDDLRPNIYLLALASSGTGKDFPRKVNSRILFDIGHINALGDKFASGQGIQDALLRSNAMLFQNDEMDGVLRQINSDRDNKLESIPNILLTLFTSADAVYPIRVKAGQKDALNIDQPHLTLFGTATPRFFYESLSQRMLTNGLFARMMIVDIGKRGRGQRPGSARHMPDNIIKTAMWWAEHQPGTRKSGNLYEVHPEPRVVPITSEAEDAVERLQRMGEDEYDRADAAGDEIGKVIWSRTCENAKKFALLYACSENHENSVIGLNAVEWATAFAMHQTRRQLYLAMTYVAENPFHAQCLKVIQKLQQSPKNCVNHSTLLKRLRCSRNEFQLIIDTLIEQDRIERISVQTKTKTGIGYRLK